MIRATLLLAALAAYAQDIRLSQNVLSGRVATDLGDPPGAAVAIELVCGGVPREVGTSDPNGSFSLNLNYKEGATSAYQRGTTTAATPGFCVIRANLAGYRSQEIRLDDPRLVAAPDLGVLLIHKIGEGDGNTVSASSVSAPKEAKNALAKGREAARKKKLDEALRLYRQALSLHPAYAEASYEIGRVEASRNAADEARRAFEAAIAADPKYIPPYLDLCVLEFQAQRWKELAALSDKAVQLDPFAHPQIFVINAAAHYNLRELDAAAASARRAQTLDTRHQNPKSYYLLGIILAQQQNLSGAAEQLREYLKLAGNAPDAPAVRAQLEAIERKLGAAPIR